MRMIQNIKEQMTEKQKLMFCCFISSKFCKGENDPSCCVFGRNQDGTVSPEGYKFIQEMEGRMPMLSIFNTRNMVKR